MRTLNVFVTRTERLRRRTYDIEVMGSTSGRVTIIWSVLGWVIVWRQINHLGI